MYRHYRPALTHEQTKKVDITCYMVDIPLMKRRSYCSDNPLKYTLGNVRVRIDIYLYTLRQAPPHVLEDALDAESQPIGLSHKLYYFH